MRHGLAIAAACALSVIGPSAASAAVTADFNNNVLTVEASGNANDGITITCDTGFVRVSGASEVDDVECGDVAEIEVDGDGSDNEIDLSGVTASSYTNLTATSISGGGGADDITGSVFGDAINGDAGTDDLDGGNGVDALSVDNGPDTVNGGGGVGDTLIVLGGLASIVQVVPGVINAGSTQITFSGIESAEFHPPNQTNSIVLEQAPFPSLVQGGTGSDGVITSPHDDVLHLGGGTADSVSAQTDAPQITVTASSLSGDGPGTDTLSGVETVALYSPSAFGLGQAAVDSFWDASSFPGKAMMWGGLGHDVLIGGSGGDQLGVPDPNPAGIVEPGDDLLRGNGGTNQIGGGTGTDALFETDVNRGVAASATSIEVDGAMNTIANVEALVLTGGAGDDVLGTDQFPGRAVLDGAGGSDTLVGGPIGDRITGGPGKEDLLAGNDGIDTLAETATAPTSASIDANGNFQGFGGNESISIGDIERLELHGSSGNDTFTAAGFPGPVLFDGRGGDDMLTGGSAADTLRGGAGIDSLFADEGVADLAINCGADSDSAEVDAVDPTPLDCETVNGAPVGSPGGGNPDPGSTGPGPGPSNAGSGGNETETLDRIAPTVVVSAGRVDRRGRFPLRFSCPVTETSCAGSFRLLARNTRGGTITVGRGSFTAQGGAVASVQVKLTKAGRALLRQQRKLRVTVAMTATDAAGNAAESNPQLTLRPKPRRR